MTEPSATADRLGNAIVRGAAWVIGLRITLRLLGLVSTLILARLLTPEDFGLIALATVILRAVEVLGEFNFSAWLIREQDPPREAYDTVWTLSLIRSLVVAVLVLMLAGPASEFYGDPRLVNALLVLAGITALSGLDNIGLIDFQKKMRFDREFLLFTSVRLGAFVVTVGLALAWRSYWALLAGSAAAAALRLVLSYRLHPHRPRLCFASAGQIFGYSKWLLSAGIFAFVYLRSRTLVLGKLVDAQALGIFSVAQEISNVAATEMVAPLRRVLFPAYSRLRDQPDALLQAFVHTFAVILILGLPLACGIGLVAEPLVNIALGDQWSAAAPIIQVMVFYGIGSIGLATQGPLLMTLGHTRALSHLYTFGAVLQLPAVLFATPQYGLNGAATAIAGVHLLLLAASLTVTLSLTSLTAAALLRVTWRALVSLLVMIVAVWVHAGFTRADTDG